MPYFCTCLFVKGGATIMEGGATFLLRGQTIQQNTSPGGATLQTIVYSQKDYY